MSSKWADPPNPFRLPDNNPPVKGVSTWSSCSYDIGFNWIYIGIANAVKSRIDYTPLLESKICQRNVIS
jgi:hypothetical protein